MFSLTEDDLEGRILSCADGPASFNAELRSLGTLVTSTDPLYQYSASEIRQRITDATPEIIEQTRINNDEFCWSDKLVDADTLIAHRLKTMDRFLEDYESGRQERRYIPAELPNLPFANDAFDLIVCSHFLFLYSEQLSAQFHLDSVRSMVRVAKEIRLFPLLEMGGISSRHLMFVREQLKNDGLQITVETVDYEFQKGGNQMMRIRKG